MTSSATGRTWDNADAPSVTRAAKLFDAAWRNAIRSGSKTLPDPRRFLDTNTPDLPAALLALLRAELAARFTLGPREPLEQIFSRYPELNGEARVGLIYEEYCLREEAGESPEIDEYLDRFPAEADSLRRVLEIHDWVGSAPSPSILKNLSGSASLGSTLQNLAPMKPVFPEAGQTIGEFDLIEELGRGSFARVFLAKDRLLGGRPVAVKVARSASAEPITLARLQHTHIVPLYSHKVDPDSGLHMLCMPYYGRVTLSRLLNQSDSRKAGTGSELLRVLDQLQPTEGDHAIGQRESEARQALRRLTFPQAIAWWAARLAEGLQHAHDRGILHRDVKPSNVLVTRDGTPMLLDFNLAENLTLDESVMSQAKLGGTLLYMAPEHLEGLIINDARGVDGRADIFSMGVVLFEALTGQRPFDVPRQDGPMVESIAATARERRLPPPSPRARNPEIPATLDAIVRKCLAPAVADRYARPGDLAHDLQAFLEDEPLQHTPLRLSLRFGSIVRRNRVRIAAAIPIVIALGAIVAAERKSTLTDQRNSFQIASLMTEAEKAEKAGDYGLAARNYQQIAQRSDLEKWFDQLDPEDPPAGSPSEKQSIISRYEGNAAIRSVSPIALMREDASAGAERTLAMASVVKRAQDFLAAAPEIRFALLGFDTSANKDGSGGLGAFDVAVRGLNIDPKNGSWIGQELFFRVLEDRDKVESKPLASGSGSKPGAKKFANTFRDELRELIYLRVLAEHSRVTNASRPTLLNLCELGRRLTRPSAIQGVPSSWDALKAHLLGQPGPKVDELVYSEQDAVACGQWAQLLKTQGENIRALDLFKHAVFLDQNRVWTQLALADLYLQFGYPSEAARHYDAATILAPDSPWPYIGRASFAIRVGDFATAERDSSQAEYWTDKEPDHSYVKNLATFCYGSAQRALGRWDEAYRDFSTVEKNSPRMGLKLMASLNLAGIDAARKHTAEARERLDWLISEFGPLDWDGSGDPPKPKYPQDGSQFTLESAISERAELRLRTEDYAGASEDCDLAFRVIADSGPRDKGQVNLLRAEFLSIRASAQLSLGHLEEASKNIEEALGIRETPERRRLLDRILVALGDVSRLSDIRPEDVRLWRHAGRPLKAELAKFAEKLASEPRKGDKATLINLEKLAIIRLVLGEGAKAMEAANDAVARFGAGSPRPWGLRAEIRLGLGEHKGIAEDLGRALALAPEAPGLLELRARWKLKEAKPKEALEDLNRADQGSNWPRLAVDRGRAQLALRDLIKAEQAWRLAILHDPYDPEGYLGAAETAIEMDSVPQARARIMEAEQRGGGDPSIAARAKVLKSRCDAASATPAPES